MEPLAKLLISLSMNSDNEVHLEDLTEDIQHPVHSSCLGSESFPLPQVLSCYLVNDKCN